MRNCPTVTRRSASSPPATTRPPPTAPPIAAFLAAWAANTVPKSTADFFAVGGWDAWRGVRRHQAEQSKFTGDEAMSVLKGWKNPTARAGRFRSIPRQETSAEHLACAAPR